MRSTAAGRGVIALLLALTVLMGAVSGPVAGAAADDLAFDGNGAAPNPYANDDLTVASHPGEWGYTDSAMRFYFNDQGEKTLGKYRVNTTSDVETGDNVNPYSFVVTDVEDDDFGAFPRRGADEDDDSTDASAAEDNLASALDAGEWTKSGANSSKLTISDTSTGPNVDAVRFNTGTAMAAGDVATGSYANWTDELDSDESKRVLQLGVDVSTLDAGTEVQIDVTDESGDYKRVVLNSSRNYGDSDVVANGTGDGYVLQVKLSDLTTNGGGSFDNIESIDVTIRDGDADVAIAWVDLQKKGVVELGEQKVPDSDGDYVDTDTVNSSFKGAISVHSMTTLPAMWDDAVIHDVSFPVVWPAELLTDQGSAAEYQIVEDSADQYVGYDVVGNISYRIEVTNAIDLTHSNLDLVLDQEWPSERYVELGLVEGAGDSEFGGLDYTDKTGVLGSASADSPVVLDGTVSAGTAYAINFKLKLTAAEWDGMRSPSGGTPAGGAGGGPIFSTGGLVEWLIGLPGLAIALVSAGFARLRGWV